MIVGFHHPGLVVPDLAAARRFYSEALGFEYIREYGWDESSSELAEQVLDIHAAFDRFVAAGGVAHNQPVQGGEAWSSYARDPFGNIIELMQLGSDEPDFDLIACDMLPPAARP